MDAPSHAISAAQARCAASLARAIGDLSAQTVDALGDCYHPEAVFIDPFHTVAGRAAIAKNYAAMFRTLHQPRFVALQFAAHFTPPLDTAAPLSHDGRSLSVCWVFEFARNNRHPTIRIPGTSWLWVDGDGLITRHEDHWDAAELFAAFPGLGWLIRRLKTRISQSANA